MTRALRIAAWNGNGLLQRIHEIEVLFWDQKIDICLMSETHLTGESCPKIKSIKAIVLSDRQNWKTGVSCINKRKYKTLYRR